MNGILKKLDSYQILTNLLPGAFFGLTLKFFVGLTPPTQNIGEDIAVYYFMGLIINRVGSLVVEPILKKLRFIKYASYPDFAKATKTDSKINTLSEMNNYTRSLLACILLLPIIQILKEWALKCSWLTMNWKWVAIVLLFLLFLFAYRKQTDYVCKRVAAVNSLKVMEKEVKVEV